MRLWGPCPRVSTAHELTKIHHIILLCPDLRIFVCSVSQYIHTAYLRIPSIILFIILVAFQLLLTPESSSSSHAISSSSHTLFPSLNLELPLRRDRWLRKSFHWFKLTKSRCWIQNSERSCRKPNNQDHRAYTFKYNVNDHSCIHGQHCTLDFRHTQHYWFLKFQISQIPGRKSIVLEI